MINHLNSMIQRNGEIIHLAEFDSARICNPRATLLFSMSGKAAMHFYNIFLAQTPLFYAPDLCLRYSGLPDLLLSLDRKTTPTHARYIILVTGSDLSSLDDPAYVDLVPYVISERHYL
jgi:hypothetical protein